MGDPIVDLFIVSRGAAVALPCTDDAYNGDGSDVNEAAAPPLEGAARAHAARAAARAAAACAHAEGKRPGPRDDSVEAAASLEPLRVFARLTNGDTLGGEGLLGESADPPRRWTLAVRPRRPRETTTDGYARERDDDGYARSRTVELECSPGRLVKRPSRRGFVATTRSGDRARSNARP